MRSSRGNILRIRVEPNWEGGITTEGGGEKQAGKNKKRQPKGKRKTKEYHGKKVKAKRGSSVTRQSSQISADKECSIVT